MQIDPSSATQAVHFYSALKFWLPMITAAGLLWKMFQGVNWLKSFKSDIMEVKKQLDSQTSILQSQLAQQTNAIVTELKDIRQDFRMVMAPPPRLARARSSKKNIDTDTDSHV
jgi:hypothetical protein